MENPAISANGVDQVTKRKVFIATTRAQSEAAGEFLSAYRTRDLVLAAVTVTIPPSHELGQLEQPRSLPPDPRTEFTVIDPIVYGSDDAFISDVNAALREWPAGQRDILLFVHGYNTSASDAVLRLAQFVNDSGFDGVPVLLSWASANQAAKYVYDLNSALIAREKVPEIQGLLDRTNAESYNLFAHSMGTLLVMEGLVEASQRRDVRRRGRLQNVILAAPDIDLDLFRSQLAQLEAQPYNLFVLLSEDDRALSVSRFIAGGVPRVGASEGGQLSELGVIVVDLTEIDDRSSLSHSKFFNSPDVVQLVGRGLNRVGRFDESQPEQRLDNVLLGVSVRILF